MPGTLFVVATPIGNLEDITLRALRVLRESALIAAEDTRRTAHLLARHGISTPSTSLHEHNEAQKTPTILGRLERGEHVALVSDAGTPVISDPGARLIRAAIAAGIRVEPIPGPSAILAALMASGLPAESFTFVGFPPTRSKARKTWFDRIHQIGGTIVFFEAPHRIASTLEELARLSGDVPVAIGRELTKIHETLVRGPISEVLRQLGDPKGEFTVVADIGQSTELNRAAVGASGDLSKRQALAVLAAESGLTANQLYQAVENAKKSVDRPT
jgi:16S rRNA (cytidine1402-2'-O)-methyltransferase